MVRVFVALVLLLSWWPAAYAFVVEGPRGQPVSAQDRLERAPRWAVGEGSLLEAGERGLSGGIEYAVDDSLCDLRFVDDSTCSDARLALRDALNLWSDGHPVITFVDVTGSIEPAFPLAAIEERGQGAEIDFFGTLPSRFPPFHGPHTHGYTIFYARPSAPYSLTNGQIANGADGRIESADVRFNAARCYYIDPNLDRPDCVHFPTLVLHEVGHALGIAHPEQFREHNLDTDHDPTNEILINCTNPLEGLIHSAQIEGKAVAVGRDVQGPGRWNRGLTWDDVAARDALYPHCGIERRDRGGRVWGAYATNQFGEDGRAINFASEPEASEQALQACSETGAACKLIASFSDCFAFARASDGRTVQAVAARSETARANAMLGCAENNLDCTLTADFCAFE